MDLVDEAIRLRREQLDDELIKANDKGIDNIIYGLYWFN
jgi:hypothetical protein